MMEYQKNGSTEEIMKMDMECEWKTTFTKGRPCSRKTGICVLLGTVCMIIFMIMTSVILFHQQRTFSELESWMNVHSSNQTSVKPDLQITEVQVKNIETLMSNLASSLSSILSKQEENQQKLESLSSSLSEMKSSVSDLTSSVASLSSKQQTSEERVMNALKDLISNMSNKTAGTDVPVTCKSGWIPYKSSCFFFSINSLTWTQARDYCQTQDALLLKIQDDDGEWAFLNHHTIPTSYWVGLTDQITSQWRWVDDTPYIMNAERWNPGQPDDWTNHGLGEEGEDCGQISYSGKLNDCHCSMKLKYICRVEI